MANEVRAAIEAILDGRGQELKTQEIAAALAKETIDITLPGKKIFTGGKHPLTQVIGQIEDIFLGMGYTIAEGPEIELDYYNFEALNIPPEHPARDMQDSFYITEEVLLRTQTSPVQVRTMEKLAPQAPVKIICPGKVYRRDDDATHSPMFHQVEGLVIDKGISMADLKGTLLTFARQMFGADREIRLRPSFFPFTEPQRRGGCFLHDVRRPRLPGSAPIPVGWKFWAPAWFIPGFWKWAATIHRRSMRFAFGMGVERVTMLKYGIDDLRLLFENDLRFLTQF